MFVLADHNPRYHHARHTDRRCRTDPKQDRQRRVQDMEEKLRLPLRLDVQQSAGMADADHAMAA